MRESGPATAIFALLIAGCVALPGGDPPAGDRGPAFAELNGVMWFYTTANDIRFDQIAASLDDLERKGIRVIGIYSPYHGKVDQWLGAAPIDFYQTPPQCGSVDDFRDLVAAAHDRGMKVIAFMGFHSIDERSEMFATAEAQYAAGDRGSPEVSAFHWTDDPSAPTPAPAPYGPSEWKLSETAGAYYWALWDNAGLDVNLPAAAAEIERAIDFWMATGLDGLMLDSGVVHGDFRELWIDLPLSHHRDLWLTFESTQAWNAGDYHELGMTAWFAFEDNDYANTYSRVVMPEDGEAALDADGLEAELAAVDWARERGRLTHAWSVLERAYPDGRMRAQEAALLAGAGILYGAPMYRDSYLRWPELTRERWEQVLGAVAASPALAPTASRRRLATSDPKSYAMLRVAASGSEAAIAVYNFGAEPAAIGVDLGGAAVDTDRRPVELAGVGQGASIAAGALEIELGGYGFALLEVGLR